QCSPAGAGLATADLSRSGIVSDLFLVHRKPGQPAAVMSDWKNLFQNEADASMAGAGSGYILFQAADSSPERICNAQQGRGKQHRCRADRANERSEHPKGERSTALETAGAPCGQATPADSGRRSQGAAHLPQNSRSGGPVLPDFRAAEG